MEGIFRLGHALDEGDTPGRIKGRLDRKAIQRIRHGVYADSECVTLAAVSEARTHGLHAGAALLRLAGEPAVSHESAALLHGIPTLGRLTRGTVQLTRERRGRGTARYLGIVVRQARLPEHHRARTHDLPVTTVARTVVDIARTRDFRAGVVAADAAMHLRLCTREELMAVLRDCAGWPGIARAGRAIRFATLGAESPLESISRVAFHEYGLPVPQLQAQLLYDRVDFLWLPQMVIGEADGALKYATRDDLMREKGRQEWLESRGYVVVRWGWREAFAGANALCYRIEETLKRRASLGG